MVLSNAAKAARKQASLVNRQNVCGGVKKAGLAPSVGWFMTGDVNLRRSVQCAPKTCNPLTMTMHPTQQYGYRATHSGRMG